MIIRSYKEIKEENQLYKEIIDRQTETLKQCMKTIIELKRKVLENEKYNTNERIQNNKK